MPQSVNFLHSRLREWSRLRPGRVAFSSPAAAVTYDDLFKIAEVLRDHFPGRPLVGICVPRTVQKASLVAGCIASGIPGFCIETKAPSLYVRKMADQFLPSHLLVARGQWPELSAAFRDINCEAAPLDFFGGEILRVALNRPRSPGGEMSWMLLTSGSTGERKGVRISADALAARALEEIADFDLREADRLLNILSFAHDLGLNQLLSSLWTGAELRLRNPVFARDLADLFINERFDGVTATPLVWQRVLAATPGELPTENSPRFITVSGGQLSLPELRRLHQWMPSAKIIRTYGQTETFRSLISEYTGTGDLDLRFHRPVQEVEVRLAGPDGRTLEGAGTGELVHRGPASMTGYFGGPDMGEEIFTGDTFRRDAEGGMEFIGRGDEIIKRFDHRVSLPEIERVLGSFKDLAAATVVPGARDKLIAFVVPRAGVSVSEEEIRNHAVRNMPYFMVPDRFVVKHVLPQTAAFKIDKEVLRRESAGLS